jgi:hypothetical protein
VTRSGRRWSEAEDAALRARWGRDHAARIGHEIGRSGDAVVTRARRLGLGAANDGHLSMNAVARETGYSLSRLWTAVRDLRLRIRRVWRTDRRRRRGSTFSVTPEQVARIGEYLRGQPDARVYGSEPGKGKTKRGVWNVGRKPPCCLGCYRVDRPHFARGLCGGCYLKLLRGRLASPLAVVAPRRPGRPRVLPSAG